MQKIIVNILAMLMIVGVFGCKGKIDNKVEAKVNKKIERTNITKSLETEDSFPQLTELDFNVMKPIKLNSRNDSIKYLLGDCTNKFCYFSDNMMYRFSNNRKYILEYNPYTSNNILYNSKMKKLGELKLEANNPEFSIETLPLEEEAGILFVDRIYGISKYSLVEGKFVKKWNIQLNLNNFHIKPLQNELFITLRDDKSAYIKRYSLEDGNLIREDKIDYLPYTTKIFPSERVIVLYNKEKLSFYNLSDSKIFNTNINNLPHSIALKKQNNQLFGFYLLNNDIFSFFQKGDSIISKKLKNSFIYSLNNIILDQNLLLINYYLTNTPGILNNNTQFIERGVLIQNIKNKKWYKLKDENKNSFSTIYSNDNKVYYRIGKRNIYEINLEKLKTGL